MKPRSRLVGLMSVGSISLAAFLFAGCKSTPKCCWPHEKIPKTSNVRDAANRGNAAAQNDMGIVALHGHPSDREGALKWFRASADQNYAPAQHNIGLMYWRGEIPGMKCPDHCEGLKWFLKAAQQDYPPSLSCIGDAYRTGRGVPQSYREALHWYREAAAYNYADAEYQLGVYYDNGHEFRSNGTEAYKWFILAGAQGHCAATKARDNIARKLTREEIQEAQRRAQAWCPKNASGGGQ